MSAANIRRLLGFGQDDVVEAYGSNEDVTVSWDDANSAIEWLPRAADTGAFHIGDGSTDMDFKLFLGATTKWALFDVGNSRVEYEGLDFLFNGTSASATMTADFSADQLDFNGIDLRLQDSDEIRWGDVSDMVARWDGVDFDFIPAADDTVFKIGNGTLSCDFWIYGNIPTSYIATDASASLLKAQGPMRVQGFNTIGPRYELRWIAGAFGKPAANDDIISATEALNVIADPDFEVGGTNATTSEVTHNAEGGVTLTTKGDADPTETIILPHLDTSQTAWTQTTWGTDKETHWECHIKTGSSIGNTAIWAGLKETLVNGVSVDDDAVWFRYQNGVANGNWQAKSAIATTDVDTDSSVTVATGTEYHLKIVILANRTAEMYIDGVLIRTTLALTTAKDFEPYIGIANIGASAAKTLDVYGQSISRITG